MRVPLDSLTSKQLKSELQKRGLQTTGTKSELQLRLREELACDDIEIADMAHQEADQSKPGNPTREEFEHLKAEISSIASMLKTLIVSRNNGAERASAIEPSDNKNVGITRDQQPCVIVPRKPENVTTEEKTNTQPTMIEPIPANCSIPSESQPLWSKTCTISEVAGIIPEFDPFSELSMTSQQFIDRINMLRELYGWDDRLIILAVAGKLKGMTKLWFDSRPTLYTSWISFAFELSRDFPSEIDEAAIHTKLIRSERQANESVEVYFHRMCATARKGNVSERATIKYIRMGLRHQVMQNAIAGLDFSTTAEMLATIRRFLGNTIEKTRDRTENKFIPAAVNSATNAQNLHTVEEIRNASSNVPSNRAARKKPVCYNCWESGHIALQCTKPQRRERCTVCLRTTHTTSQCPEQSKFPTKSVRRIANTTTQGSACTTNVLMYGNDIEAFIDPGSDHSLIRRTTANELCDVSDSDSIMLKGFAGGSFMSDQCVDTVLIMDGHELACRLLVVDDVLIPEPILLGSDVLCAADNRLVLESGRCRLEKINMDNLVIGTSLSEAEKNHLSKVVAEFPDCFADDIAELGRCRSVKMAIKVNSTTPVNLRPYRIPFPKRGSVERIISELLANGIIRPSTSEYASPIVMVKKSNGEDRLCVDYRSLNSITVKLPSPMPTVEEQLSLIGGNRYFTALDLMSGYYQIPIEESSKKYTAFVTHEGHYEFNVMPFGLVNAPAVFQQSLSQLVKKMKGQAVSYVDEVIISSKSISEGILRLKTFLQFLRIDGLTLRVSKCVFLAEEASFLGHRITADNIKPGSAKTSAVENFAQPKTITDVRRFLGLTGYFRKFIKNYAYIAQPLTKLLKKDNIGFPWEEEQEAAFRELKRLLCKEPVLTIYDANKDHEVHTDASSKGLAGVLLQRTEDKILKPVCFYSRLCTESEQKLHSYELEVLAIVETLDRFRMYLLGKPFRILSDCSAISALKTSKPLAPRMARWLLKLQEYDAEIIHRAGKNMLHVDALSRNPVEDPKAAVDVTERVMMITMDTGDWVAAMQHRDPVLKTIVATLQGKQNSEHAAQYRKEYRLHNDRLYRITEGGEKFVVPHAIRWRIVKLFHDDMGHFGIEKTIQRISQRFWFSRMRNYVKSYIASCIQCGFNKSVAGKLEGQLHVNNIDPIPFRVLHLDHLGPFPKSKRGNLYIIAASDPFSKYVILKAVKSTKSKPVIEMLNELTSFFGLPIRIVSDRGTAFTCHEFEAYCRENQIQHIKTAVRTPRANGQVERVNRNILNFLRTSTDDRHTWDKLLRNMQWTLNSMKNATTKYSPNEIVFDFNLRDIIHNELLFAINSGETSSGNSTQGYQESEEDSTSIMKKRDEAARNIMAERKRWKARFDRSHQQPRRYEEGDLVLVENALAAIGESRKLEPRFKGPYRIKKVLRYDRYVIEPLQGQDTKISRDFTTVYSSDKLKPWCELGPESDLMDEYNEDTERLETSLIQERPSCQLISEKETVQLTDGGISD